MKLSDFFNINKIQVNGEFKHTGYFNSRIPDTITFAETDYYFRAALINKNITCIIAKKHFCLPPKSEVGVVISKTPKKDFFLLHNKIAISSKPLVNDKKYISKKAKISATCVIKENVVIEDDVIIDDFAVIESNTILGKGTHVCAHAVIGAKGMNNSFIKKEFINLIDVGGVRIGNNCKVLANAVIQKSYFYEFTEIKNNSIISCNTNIGHGSIIDENVLIAGGSQVSGYVKIGQNSWIGPSVTIGDNVVIGNNTKVLIGSVVVENIKDNQTVSGNFAFDHKKNIRDFMKKKND